MQKNYTLIIPSWYPTDKQPLNGIFIQKHVEAISTFQDVVVMYITGDSISNIQETKVSNSCATYFHFYAESSSSGYNQVKYIWSQVKAYRNIVGKYGRPSSLHLHVVFPAGIFVYLLLLVTDIPLVITEHWTGYMDEDGRYKKQSSLIKYITRILFQKARKVSVVSEYFKQLLTDLKLVDASKLVTVYNILNIPQTAYSQNESKTLKALYIGNLIDEQKNISMLIDAIEIVVTKYPTFQFTMVGGGVEKEKFIKASQDKGLLDKNIFFKGYIANDKLTAIYQENVFFVLTSNFETFNIAAAEAMLSGLPVVSTHCGGPAEFLNERTGIWIKNKNAQETADAIIQMIEGRGHFDSSGIALETQRKFSFDTILGQLRNLYNAILV